MNATQHLTNTGGWVLCALLGGVLVWMLTGCTSNQEQPRSRGAYYEPSPQVVTSYVGIHTERDSYEPLSPYGRWEIVGADGRGWIPGRIDADGQPNSNGYRQRTKDEQAADERSRNNAARNDQNKKGNEQEA